MDNAKLGNYAELLVRSGGNVQPGQLVIVSCAVEDAYFGRMVAEAAYDAGAGEVRFDWHDEKMTRMKYLRAASETFDKFPQYMVQKLDEQDADGAVYLAVISDDPDNLKGVDPDRLQRWTKVARTATKPHAQRMMTNVNRWSLLAIPSPAWAAKVFPGMPTEEAIQKLWGMLLKGARADGANPRADWDAHKANFTRLVSYLNGQNFAKLRITTGLGTDVTLGLAQNHVWVGGGDMGKDGVPFFPNLPTEEIFTMPDRNIADGRVVASMPLSYQGNLIENFEMTFVGGKVESYKAEKGGETLQNLMEIDEGAKRLGEVAIVSNSSPIGQMNTLFYNTLFDENASAHLALGKSYPNNMKGGDELETEELVKRGGNDSLIHVDFMFGTSDMKIVGIQSDGTEICFFDNGEYTV